MFACVRVRMRDRANNKYVVNNNILIVCSTFTLTKSPFFLIFFLKHSQNRAPAPLVPLSGFALVGFVTIYAAPQHDQNHPKNATLLIYAFIFYAPAYASVYIFTATQPFNQFLTLFFYKKKRLKIS